MSKKQTNKKIRQCFSAIFVVLKNGSPLQQRFFWVGGWVFILPQKPLCFLMPGIFCKACCIGLGKHALHWLGLDMLCFTKSVFWCWVAKPMGHGMHNTILDAKPSACNLRIVGHTHSHTNHVLGKACCFQEPFLLSEACASLKAKLCGWVHGQIVLGPL